MTKKKIKPEDIKYVKIFDGQAYCNDRKIVEIVVEATKDDVKESYHRDSTGHCGEKRVLSVDLDTGEIVYYDSLSQAHRVTGVDMSSIRRAADDIYKRAGNYKWQWL